MESHSVFVSYYVMLICVLFLKYFLKDSEGDFYVRETELQRLPVQLQWETGSHTSSISLKLKKKKKLIKV